MNKILPIINNSLLKFIFLILSFVFCNTSYCQEEAIKISSADTVLLFNDGTWKLKEKLIPNRANSSDVRVEKKLDAITNKYNLNTKSWYYFGKSKQGYLSGYIRKMADNPWIYFHFSFNEDLGCFSKYNSKIQIKLENDKIIVMDMISETDCDSNPNGIFVALSENEQELSSDKALEIQKNNIDLLLNFKWKQIRLFASEGYTDVIPNSTWKVKRPNEYFIQHLDKIKSDLK